MNFVGSKKEFITFARYTLYNMKNNYSKRLMDVLEYSREEAARLQNSYIGPEHLMLGIIRDGEGKAMEILHGLNVDERDVKKRIEEEIKNTCETEEAVQHNITVSKTTERVLRMSMLESRLFKKEETDTEHLLLAILKEEFNRQGEILEDEMNKLQNNGDYSLKDMQDLIQDEKLKKLAEEANEAERNAYNRCNE